MRKTTALRRLLKKKAFVYMPVAYDALYTGRFVTQEQCVKARQEIETLVGLDEFCEVEEQTVEGKKWGKRWAGPTPLAARSQGGDRCIPGAAALR